LNATVRIRSLFQFVSRIINQTSFGDLDLRIFSFGFKERKFRVLECELFDHQFAIDRVDNQLLVVGFRIG